MLVSDWAQNGNLCPISDQFITRYFRAFLHGNIVYRHTFLSFVQQRILRARKVSVTGGPQNREIEKFTMSSTKEKRQQLRQADRATIKGTVKLLLTVPV